uniref:Uncharacterized protein n=1 Tax=viral metagenome TaxID=1070528 RepID=A0A6M3KW86_9ZZZZ
MLDWTPDPSKCRKSVYGAGSWPSIHQCTRKPWKDGYCKQHHPDTVAARRAESEARYIAKLERSPSAMLAKANKRIAELEMELAILRGGGNA